MPNEKSSYASSEELMKRSSGGMSEEEIRQGHSKLKSPGDFQKTNDLERAQSKEQREDVKKYQEVDV